MAKLKVVSGLKGHKWEVQILEHKFETSSYFYWEARNDKQTLFLTNTFQFKNRHSAVGNWRDLSKVEGITNYTIVG